MRETFSYSTFTRKQANTIYGAFKGGEIVLTKAQSRKMYDMIGANWLAPEDREFVYALERAIGYIVDGKLDFAQAAIDGKLVRKTFERKVMREAEWFDDAPEGTIIEDVETWTDWVIAE